MSVIARWCHRHRLVTVLAWLALIVGLGALTGAAGTKYNDTMSIPASESSQALDLLKNALPAASGDADTVVWHTTGGVKVTDPAVRKTMTDALDAIATSPGVASVALTDTPPFGKRVASGSISIDGHSTDTLLVHVDGALFDTLKIPLLRGRGLKRADAGSIVVSDSVARRLWPGQDALGKRFNFGGDCTVVGISGNARLVKLEDPDMGQIFFPVTEPDLPSLVLLVKTTGSPEPLIQTAASLAKSLDPVLFPDVQLLKSSFRRKLEPVETIATVVSLLGSVAHLLACLGIVGLVAYAVSQRTKEIGIRVALGARPAHVLSTVLRQFSIPVVAGLVLGVAGAAGLAQLLRHQLYGISNLDPVTYLAAIAVFIATVAIAALFPARKALRVDPMLALRQD